MATFPDAIFAKSPQSQRVAEFRLLDTIASGAYDGLNRAETDQFEHAISVADPRYGDDPEAACKLLKEQGWIVYGTLKRRYLTAKQAADALGVNDSRIRQFILENRLAATKDGQGHHAIPWSAIIAFQQVERPTGRPAKSTS
jgi:excisionase family DNA binding protein